MSRPIRQALFLTLAVVYLPQLLPFVFGPLMECRDHCVPTYLRYFAVLPGAFPGVILGPNGISRALISTSVSAAEIAIIVMVFRSLRLRSHLILMAAFFAVISAGNALAFASILRA